MDPNQKTPKEGQVKERVVTVLFNSVETVSPREMHSSSTAQY